MGIETLTVNLYLTGIFPNSLKGNTFGIKKLVICKTMEDLAIKLKELRDPKNSPIITGMISSIFRDCKEKITLEKYKARVSIEVVNSQNLPVVKYTKLLVGGCEFIEDKDYDCINKMTSNSCEGCCHDGCCGYF